MTESLEPAPSRIPWPPILFLCAIAVSVLLNYALPLPWFPPPLSDILFAVGWLFTVVAAYLFVAALRAMQRSNTTINPTKAADHLVTGGPFTISRNPIYLADTMIMFGIGMITGIVWFFLLGLLAAFVTQKLAIEPEERHLAARFGKRYRDYQKKARRWF